MAQDLRFVDPAFTCEVTLTGVARALYKAAEPQFERLKGVRSLGLIAQIQDVAQHTRHQHLVGLMRIFNKLCQQPERKGLPKKFLWSFWCRLCFAQTGHAALSYDSEKAVLLACHLDSDFKEQLRITFQPVNDSLAACTKCARNGCVVKDLGATEAAGWFNDLVAKNKTHQLYLWVAALKLIENSSVLKILESQVLGERNQIGFFRQEALKMLVAPSCKWDSVVRNLSRMDFIPRDLAFAGTIGIKLDVDSLIAAADEKHPDWKLLASLSNYMSENIYESPDLQLQSTLCQRALAGLLIKGRVTIKSLFWLELSKAFSDDTLRVLVAKTQAGKQVFNRTIREDWRVWPIKSIEEVNRTPSEIEKGITGHAKGHLIRHVDSKLTVVKFRQPGIVALAMRHHDSKEKPDAKAFVKLCRSILPVVMPGSGTKGLTNALYEGLVDRQCEHGLIAVVRRLAGLGLNETILKKPVTVLNERVTSLPDDGMTIQVGGFAYKLPSDNREFQVNAMHAAVSGGETVQRNLGMTLKDAAIILWGELLHWQSLHFGLQPPKTFIQLVNVAQAALGKEVIAGGATAESDLEAYALLEALKHPSDSVSFRIALPNLKLMNDVGVPENEYDVVSVILKGDKFVEVWVWGVTIDQNLTTKRAQDMTKIHKLKDLLGA